MPCPFGGDCIDYGYPSDCLVNDCCFNFRSVEEKTEFDSKPDRYLLEKDNHSIHFKTRTQVKFLLADSEYWRDAKLYFVNDDGTRTQAQL